jgi:hypothetical protein
MMIRMLGNKVTLYEQLHNGMLTMDAAAIDGRIEPLCIVYQDITLCMKQPLLTKRLCACINDHSGTSASFLMPVFLPISRSHP